MTKTLTCCNQEFPCTKDTYVGRDTMIEKYLGRKRRRRLYATLFNCPECDSTKVLITHPTREAIQTKFNFTTTI